MKYFCAVYCFLFLFLSFPPVQAGELKCYSSGETTPFKKAGSRQRLYRTNKTLNFPLSIQMEIFKENYKKNLQTQIGFKYNTAVTLYTERVLLMNGSPQKLSELHICFEYYYLKIPYKLRNKRRVSNELKDLELYNRKIYKLPPVKPKTKIIIDTPGIEFFYSTDGSTLDYELFYLDENNEAHSVLFGAENAGCIVSLFDGEKLLYQVTNNKRLQESGLEQMTEKLYEEYKGQ